MLLLCCFFNQFNVIATKGQEFSIRVISLCPHFWRAQIAASEYSYLESIFFQFQDAQEFLRCFMDQIHEELKQPLPITESDTEEHSDKDLSSDPEDRFNPRPTFPQHDRQVSVDSTNSSQSEECYETCDSGNNTASSNETASNESNDCSEIGTSGVRVRTSPRMKTRSQEMTTEVGLQRTEKEKKDSTNELIAMTRNEEPENTSVTTEPKKPRVQRISENEAQKITSAPKRGVFILID